MKRLSERAVKREIETEKEMKRLQKKNKKLGEQNKRLRSVLFKCQEHLEALDHLRDPDTKLHPGLKSKISQALEEVEDEIS